VRTEVLALQKLRDRRSSTYLTCRRWTAEEAQQALVAWEKSGIGLSAFAVDKGLDPQRLTRWRRRLVATGSPTFEEILPCVAVAPLESDAAPGVTREPFEVVLPSGRIVRVPESFDAGALRRLLAVVDEARAC
jgi:transposase-like protein